MSSLLTTDIQDKLRNVLIEEGLVASSVIEEAEQDAMSTNRQLVAVLVEKRLLMKSCSRTLLRMCPASHM